jgi:hypothetical protein
VDSVLTTGPKVAGLNPAEVKDFSKVIKIHSTLYFGWEVKPEVPCYNILWHVKNHLQV